MSDIIVFSLALKSGDFKSELHLPLPRTPEQTKQTVKRWLDFMSTGLRLSAERMDAVLEDCVKGEGHE
jgi:hypothetical protein